MEHLLKRAEFLAVAGKGRKWGVPGILVQVLKKDQEAPRVGFTASRHVGNAVLRNKAKRRLRMLMTELNGKLQPYDIVLVARKETVTCDFAKLREALHEALTKLQALA